MLLKDNGKNGTLKHRLVSYVMDYDKPYFLNYVRQVAKELRNRHINIKFSLYDEIYDFCNDKIVAVTDYPEHNDRYLQQCYYNLEEKYDRGIITEDEWDKIHEKVLNILTGKEEK